MRSFEQEINETDQGFDCPRFAGIVRLYTARQVVEQRGTIGHDYTIACEAAVGFYNRLRELFAERRSITTFGPYSPGNSESTTRGRRSSPKSSSLPSTTGVGRSILSVRDQNTFADSLRKKRLMTLVHLFLVRRFKADSVHYVTPTEDNQYQVAKMRSHGIFREVNTEVGQIIVADCQPPADLRTPDAGSGGIKEADSEGEIGYRDQTVQLTVTK